MDAQTALTTIAGVGVVVTIALQLVKGLVSEDVVSRYWPLAAAVLGVVLGTAGALIFGKPPVEGVITGYFGGAVASGLYDQAKTRLGLTQSV